MARQFTAASSSYITTSIGALSAVASGTIVAVVKRTTDGAWQGLTYLASSANVAAWGMELDSSNRISALGAGATDAPSPSITVTAADGWVLIAVTKASGSAAFRYHKCVLSTGVWTHENGATAYANATAVGATGIVNIGRFTSASLDYLDGALSAIAYYSSVLTDAQLEGLDTALSAWTTLNPAAMWVFDQATVATPLADRTAGGANQTAIAGTTVVAGDPIPATLASSTPVFRTGSDANGSGTTSCSMTIPAAVQVGDMMLVSVGHKSFISGSTIATPAGWTVLNAALNGPTGNGLQGVVFRKVAVAGDPGSTLTIAGSAAQQINAAFAAYSGVDSVRSSSWVASSTTAATAVTCPAPATAAQSNDLVVVVGGARESTNGPASTPTFTGTGGVVVRSQRANSSGSAANVAAFIGDDPASSANGTRTLTASQTSYWVSGQVILVGVAAPSNVALTSAVAESLTQVDAVVAGLQAARAGGESVTSADAAGATGVRARSSGEGMTFGDGLAVVVARGRGMAEVLSAVDSAARVLARVAAIAQGLGLADVPTRGAVAYARAQSETVGLGQTGVVRSVQGRGSGETVGVADSAAGGLVRGRGTTESLQSLDVPTRTVARPRGQAESVTGGDVPGRVVSRAAGGSGSLTSADVLARSKVSLVGSVNTMTSSDFWGYTLLRAVGSANTVGLVDAAGRAAAMARADGEGLGLGDFLGTGRGVMLAVAEGLQLAAVFGRTAGRTGGWSESFSYDDHPVAGVAAGRGTAETVGVDGQSSVARVVLVGGAGALGLVDVVLRVVGAGAVTGEVLSLTNTAGRLVSRGRGVGDGVRIGDALGSGQLIQVGAAEAVVLTQTLARAATGYGRAAPQGLGLADAVARLIVRGRVVGQPVGLTDTWDAGRVLSVGVAESVQLVDLFDRDQSAGRGMNEVLALGHALARAGMARGRGTFEVLQVTDTATTGRILTAVVAEYLSLSDLASRAVAGGRAVAEPVTLASTVARGVVRGRGTVEAVQLAEAWLAQREIIPAAFAGEIVFSDAAAARVGRARGAGQSMTVADGAARRIDRGRGLPEFFTAADLVRPVRGQNADAGSQATLDDIGRASTARAVRVAETVLLFVTAGAGDQDGQIIIIAHSGRVHMTRPPSGRVTMTRPVGRVTMTGGG